jgi:uncharacterized protein (TIGR02246 family)
MTDDQRAVRAVIQTWMEATRRGDVEGVLDLMTDDAQFLVAGQPPMNKAAFESASRSQAGAQLQFDSHADVWEVHVEGTLAYVVSHLDVAVKKPGADAPLRRAGHTLTVFRKVEGRWLLCRDANLLVQV